MSFISTRNISSSLINTSSKKHTLNHSRLTFGNIAHNFIRTKNELTIFDVAAHLTLNSTGMLPNVHRKQSRHRENHNNSKKNITKANKDYYYYTNRSQWLLSIQNGLRIFWLGNVAPLFSKFTSHKYYNVAFNFKNRMY